MNNTNTKNNIFLEFLESWRNQKEQDTSIHMFPSVDKDGNVYAIEFSMPAELYNLYSVDKKNFDFLKREIMYSSDKSIWIAGSYEDFCKGRTSLVINFTEDSYRHGTAKGTVEGFLNHIINQDYLAQSPNDGIVFDEEVMELFREIEHSEHVRLAKSPEADGRAQFVLGIDYAFGRGVEKNLTEAVKWYRLAAEQGYAPAQFELADFYYDGKGVEKDLAEAVKWFRKAAEQGHEVAQYNLGILYKYGYGVEKELTKAVKWIRKAAEQGYDSAQYELAVCYGIGSGVEKDYKEAAKWALEAAKQGNDKAQYALGWCYKQGCGVDINQDEAIRWFTKSADQGNEKAKRVLSEA